MNGIMLSLNKLRQDGSDLQILFQADTEIVAARVHAALQHMFPKYEFALTYDPKQKIWIVKTGENRNPLAEGIIMERAASYICSLLGDYYHYFGLSTAKKIFFQEEVSLGQEMSLPEIRLGPGDHILLSIHYQSNQHAYPAWENMEEEWRQFASDLSEQIL